VNAREEAIAPPKPKIELNENNLLSGFMMEFGKAVVQKHVEPQIVQTKEEKAEH
jgi:hypothetical protein